MNNSEIDQDNDPSVEQKGSNQLEQCLAHLRPETELQVIFSTCTTQFLSSSSLCTSSLSCVVSIPETYRTIVMFLKMVPYQVEM